MTQESQQPEPTRGAASELMLFVWDSRHFLSLGLILAGLWIGVPNNPLGLVLYMASVGWVFWSASGPHRDIPDWLLPAGPKKH